MTIDIVLTKLNLKKKLYGRKLAFSNKVILMI